VNPQAREWDGIYWRALVEASPDVVLVVDATGTILFTNRVAPAFAERGVVGRKIWEFAVGDAAARLTETITQVIESRRAIVYEHPGFRTDGTRGWHEVRAIPVVVEGKVDRVLWEATDITERKELEEQLRQSQKMEAIGQLAGGVAHDFNNLLAVIMGFSDLASRRLPPDHPVAEPLHQVIDAARRGGELTRKLLAFSRKQIIQPRALDLGGAVTDFARMIRRVVGEDVDLRVEQIGPSIVVRADPVQLEQVLMNLCMNARQAMPTGGALHIGTRAVDLDDAFVARNAWARAGAFAEIAVRDVGVGMEAQTLSRAFEPFFTTKAEGTGLGLSTVYGIAKQHEGFVRAESSPGAGTTVSVYLPRMVDATTTPTAPESSPEPDTLRGSELVLVAEDEPALRSLFETTLVELGYRVVTARDGVEAVEAFGRYADEIAVAVLDVVMPRFDAREAYERMRRVRPDLKVIFATGYAPASTRIAELIGSRDIVLLQKPLSPLALVASIRKMIDASTATP
jgi:two-component system cell cycle sensor histidine kinase/response regulator CckA